MTKYQGLAPLDDSNEARSLLRVLEQMMKQISPAPVFPDGFTECEVMLWRLKSHKADSDL